MIMLNNLRRQIKQNFKNLDNNKNKINQMKLITQKEQKIYKIQNKLA